MKKVQKGISLIEVVIVSGIIALVSFAVANFGANIFSFNSIVQSGLLAEGDARQVIKEVAAELKEASPSNAGAYPIEVASTSEIIFFADLDNDGAREKVRYYLSDLTLWKDVVKATGNPPVYSGGTTTTAIINDIRNGTTSLFTYYDTNYTGASSPLSFPINISLIRLVKITLAVDRDPYRSPVPLFVVTQVSLRNLKDNL
jgi:type II secretory pathway pseudopilin PulG